MDKTDLFWGADIVPCPKVLPSDAIMIAFPYENSVVRCSATK